MYELGLTYNNSSILSMTNLQKFCKLVQKTDRPDKDTEHSNLLPYLFYFEVDCRLQGSE
jgi:hypothetical protein